MFKKKKKEEVEDIEQWTLPKEEMDMMMEAIHSGTLGVSFNNIEYKFNENILIDEFKNYVDATYDEHYAKDKFQATEFIIDGGHGAGFCIGNVMKYAQRYGKKGSREDARKDLMKVLHYALIGLYVHDTDEKEES